VTVLPGTTLHRITRDWFDERTVASVFEPLVADWQREYLDAPTRLRRLGVYAVGWTAGTTAVLRLMPVVLTGPAPVACRHSIATTFVAFTLIPCIVLMTPFLWQWPAVWWFAIVPQALTVALPFAIVPAAMRLAQSPAEGWARRRALVRWVASATLVHGTLVAFAVPTAGDALRTGALAHSAIAASNPSRTDRPLAIEPFTRSRGVRELSLVELVQAKRAGSLAPHQRELHHRLEFMFTPPILALLGWAIGQRVRALRPVRSMAWWALVGSAFLTTHVVVTSWQASSPAIHWVSLAIALTAALALRRARRFRP
jgi:hypothetical protein